MFLDVLAVNTYNGKRSGYLINPGGGSDRVDFGFGDETQLLKSCSLLWQNHYYVFGGDGDNNNQQLGDFLQRQLSIVNGNRLERKGSLHFDFDMGACTVLNQTTIVLCFGENERNVCRHSNHPFGLFKKTPNSNFNHILISLASFDGKNTTYNF